MWKLRELYETRPNFCVPSYILSLHLFPVIKSKTLLALKSNTLGPAFKLKQSLFLSSASHFVNLEHLVVLGFYRKRHYFNGIQFVPCLIKRIT